MAQHEAQVLIEKVAQDTVTLIHSTFKVSAIKILCSAHDILSLNLEIYQRLPWSDVVRWDTVAFKDLDRIRSEVLILHGDSFNPPTLAPYWYQQIGSLFRVLNLSFP